MSDVMHPEWGLLRHNRDVVWWRKACDRAGVPRGSAVLADCLQYFFDAYPPGPDYLNRVWDATEEYVEQLARAGPVVARAELTRWRLLEAA